MPGTLAIDLGSSTTVVAWQERGAAPRLLALPPYSDDDPCVVPSLLWLAEPGHQRPLIGRQVLDAGRAEAESPGLVRDFKRRIGAGAGSERAAGAWLSPEEAGALLLHRLWEALPAGLEPERLVLTAPIEAYRGYRSWLQQVSRSLPVPELALVDEPTAAAIGAGLAAGSRVLVVDVGGGTIDLSLVALEGGEGRAAPIAQLLRFAGRDLERSGQTLRCARVIGKAGLALGGRDIDRWIAAELRPELPAEGALLQAAERLKIQLSRESRGLQVWSPAPGRIEELRLERERFDQLLRDRGLLSQLDGLLESVLAAARREGLGRDAIDAVLPVGGGSRLPLLQAWLAERCAGLPLHGERPVEAVALGALALTPGVRLRDVLARGVSLRCWDQRSGRHHWHPLFVAGQSWPTEAPLELVLACSHDGQERMELVLGEPLPEERAEVVFVDGLPQLRQRQAGACRVEPWSQQPEAIALRAPGSAGQDRLRLAFGIDAEGQLTLRVRDVADAEPPGNAAADNAGGPPLRLGPVR